ncbi:MAG: gamma-glutamyltransferase [Rhodobiaceae bacterium]|nr:gamma-glutamyltransferase [Rhodobiaceae bacterium]
MNRLTVFLIAFILLASQASAQVRDSAAPEAATAFTFKAEPPVTAEKYMVVTAHPLATRTARNVLREGGSAADAAIAAQMVLGLVEPQSSGLGGGAFALYWDAGTKTLTSIDGRETAPAAATPERFLDDTGKPRPWPEMVPGGLSVGTPGAVALLDMLHRQHGRLAWQRLIAPAIDLSINGFGVSQRLSALLAGMGPQAFSPAARTYFFNAAGEARPLGYVLKNPAYAVTLRAIGDEGAHGFYRGAVAARNRGKPYRAPGRAR